MDEIKEWFTLNGLTTLPMATLALRLMVQYTKDLFDEAWMSVFHKRPRTKLYALAWAYAILYVTSALLGTLNLQVAFVHVFNGIGIAVVAGLMGPADGQVSGTDQDNAA